MPRCLRLEQTLEEESLSVEANKAPPTPNILKGSRSNPPPKRRLLLLAALALTTKALANDHNNLERGRPLLFDDAYSIAYGEREFQLGFNQASNNPGISSSFGFGFAKNEEFSVGFDATRGTSNLYELSYFRNLAREIGNAPAFGFRLTGNSMPGRKPSGTARFIATKAWHQYDKLHLNLDLSTNQSPGVILGYSNPIGYPRRFDQTMLAEIAFQPKQTSAGLGMRQQVSPRSVLDVGVHFGRQLRFTIGYSFSF